jgi:hypothetical protein
MTELTDLIAKANETDILSILGSDAVFRAGRRWRGPCPICGASKGKRQDGAFWVDREAGRWGCFAGGADCARGGDVVDLFAILERLSPREAAEKLTGQTAGGALSKRPAPERRRPDREEADEDRWKAELAATLWREARPATDTLADTYLRARGMFGPVLAAALRQLRFHPSAYHSGPFERPVRLPAMIGLVRAAGGATGGVHVTYLAADGSGKTTRMPAKRMWGPQSFKTENGQLPGGVWLSNPAADGGLVVAEGIESALSAAILLGGPRRVLAALSLNRLQGGLMPDQYGRIDPDNIRPDPARPAFTWPELASAPWGEVAIAVDRDMKPIKVKVRKAMGGTKSLLLDGDARARICGALAMSAWRASASCRVRAIAAERGRDFNDELRARPDLRGTA